MNHPNGIENLSEPLTVALAMEQEGKKLFTEAAGKTAGKLARRTFQFLAAEEDKHIERIEKFYMALVQSSGSQLPDTEKSTAEDRLESFNLMLESIRDEYQATSSDVEAYRMALAFETGAEHFYEQMGSESENIAVKRFYQWLIEEESMHSRLLRSCLRFVEDPAEWFRRRKR
jgi:rubrerythrin